MHPIEENVPIPAKAKAPREDRRLNGKYGFRRLEIGQSIFFPSAGMYGKEHEAARKFGSRTGRAIHAVEMDGGLRVWRLE